MDLAFVNVSILGCSGQGDPDAVGIKDNKISMIGREKEVMDRCDSSTKVINGNSGTLIPGFNDAHTHFASMGVKMSEYLDLGTVPSKQKLLEQVEKEAKEKRDGTWVVGVNWDESKWSGDREFMKKDELDRVAPNNPVSLVRVDGHITCVNSAALEKIDIDPLMQGYETEDGEPTGRLMEEAVNKVREVIEPSVEGIKRGLKVAAEEAHSLGVTSIHDAHVNKRKFEAYQSLWRSEELPIRANLYFDHELLTDLGDLGLRTGFGDDKLSVGGLKLFTDGSIGAKTAWVTNGYLDDRDNLGMSIWEPEELRELMGKAHNNGLQLAVHAIGDRAVSEFIKGMEEILSEEEGNHLRHRIEHCEMISNQDVTRLKELDIIASMQPNFIGEWSLPGGMYEDRFSGEQVEILDPLGWMADKDVTIALGSDCMPFDPLYGIHSAVNTPHEAQRLSPEQAIKFYTSGPAYAEFMESKKGSIRQGALADLTLLNGNPTEEPEEIESMEPVVTVLDGKVVFRK